MKKLLILSLLIWGISPLAGATLRVHRIDKLGPHAVRSPRFDHKEARAEARTVFAELARQNDWDFTQSSESEIFTDDGLAGVDVIVFDNNSGVLLNDSEQNAFETWVRNGGGVVGIHGASHAHKGVNEENEGDWPFWYGLWGVLHDTGPKEGPQGRRGYADWIVMEGTGERWTRRLPQRWQLDKVEWYFWKYHANFERVRVIASAEVKQNQPGLPDYYPVTWCHDYEGGRVWYTNMGHYAENYRQKEFLRHVLDGIAWASAVSVDGK